MKIDAANVPVMSTGFGGFRSPATARAFERLETRLLSSADPAVRSELALLLDEVKAKAAEVSASDRRPYAGASSTRSSRS